MFVPTTTVVLILASVISCVLLAVYEMNRRDGSEGSGNGGKPVVSPQRPTSDGPLSGLDLPEEEPGTRYIEDIIGPAEHKS